MHDRLVCVIIKFVAPLYLAAIPSDTIHQTSGYMIEIRSYNLKPGTRAQFHKLFEEQALPMLRRWKVDVVAFGPSKHDETSYFLMRAYASLEDRQQSQDAFYGSEEWRQGPREAILALIDNYTSIVIPADDALRASLQNLLK
jgi:hypothetical protein